MYKYAEPNKEFKVQPRGRWTKIYSVKLDTWMLWLQWGLAMSPSLTETSASGVAATCNPGRGAPPGERSG